MTTEKPLPQSDDCYSRISFRAIAGSGEAEGTVGWREGAENRVVFQVWGGPSFAAEGADLATAFALARDGIERADFTPMAPADGSLDELFANEETEMTASPPRFQPLLWLLVAAILLALLIPALARAEIPSQSEAVPFPNAAYEWRLDAMAGIGFVLTINGQGKTIAHYELAGAMFCDGEEDNCELDGIFPIALASAAKEPVLAAVTHVGVHSQRISVFRPLKDKAKPVFEATAEYALILKVVPDGLAVELEQADRQGNISREHRMWIAGDAGQCRNMNFDRLPNPPAPTREAAELENTLRRIARNRDLRSFVELLADDVLVSFGGPGGTLEFFSSLHQGHEVNGETEFWKMLDKLLAQGGWSEAGAAQTMTWPWFFKAWPEDDDGRDAFIGGPDVRLRAGPDEHAPVLATLPFGMLRYAAPDGEGVEWQNFGWLPVAAPGLCLGYVRAEDVVPLLGKRLIARHDGKNWKIEALVAGD